MQVSGDKTGIFTEQQTMKPKEYTNNKPDFEELVDQGKSEGRFLILHNDDVHSFDYVIDT